LIDESGHIKLIPPYTLREKQISFEEYAQFLAPEILEGQVTIGEESDWWTYGVILFLLLTGKVTLFST
jgi:serine/threonine protein kinase